MCYVQMNGVYSFQLGESPPALAGFVKRNPVPSCRQSKWVKGKEGVGRELQDAGAVTSI